MIRLFTSGILAVALLAALVLFLLIATAFPQHGTVPAEEMTAWMEAHPLTATVGRAFGFFNAYSTSWLFISINVLLSINLVACIIFRLAWTKKRTFARGGSILFHISLLGIAGAGLYSHITRLDANIILTCGEEVELAGEVMINFPGAGKNAEKRLRHPFTSFRKGLNAPESFPPLTLRLADFIPTYERDTFLVGMTSKVDIIDQAGRTFRNLISVNEPVWHDGLTITQDRYGFSPRLAVGRIRGPALLNSFIALRTFNYKDKKVYSNVISLPLTGEKLLITLYPDFVGNNGNYISATELPRNPRLALRLESREGALIDKGLLKYSEETVIGDYSFSFAELRYWSAFRLVLDNSTWLLYMAFIIGLIGLFIRFGSEMRRMFKWKPL